MAAEGTEGMISLTPAPTDGVTKVLFSPCGSAVLVAGWSGHVALHSPEHGALSSSSTIPSPALSAAWQTGKVYAGGLDGCVYSADVTPSTMSGATPLAGVHQKAVSSLASLPDGCVVSGSWDGTLRIFDPRGTDAPNELDVGEKVFCVEPVGENDIVVVTSGKKLRIFDRRAAKEPAREIVPSLNAPLRTVSASPKRSVLVVGSADGRVSVESLDAAESQSFAFKCHRTEGRAYPVNAVVHNHKYGSFATGGGDGYVSVWDGVARKRVFQYSREATSVASLAFSPDDLRMAVAVSYTFEDGECDHAPDAVYVRTVADSEIRTRDAT